MGTPIDLPLTWLMTFNAFFAGNIGDKFPLTNRESPKYAAFAIRSTV